MTKTRLSRYFLGRVPSPGGKDPWHAADAPPWRRSTKAPGASGWPAAESGARLRHRHRPPGPGSGRGALRQQRSPSPMTARPRRASSILVGGAAAGRVAGEPRTAFVLAGGAALGAMQAGMVRALDEHGTAPDLLIGPSAGALNAALLASRPATVATAEGMAAASRRRP